MKKNKALIVLTMAFGAIAFNSCKKDKQQNPPAPPPPVVTIPPGITANIDSVATAFNMNASGESSNEHDTTFTTIFGSLAHTGFNEIITVTIRGQLVAGKTYSAATTPGLEPFFGYTTGVHDFSNDPNSPNKVSVTINSVSADSVSGTFKGGVIETFGGGPVPETRSITNGKFNVSLRQ